VDRGRRPHAPDDPAGQRERAGQAHVPHERVARTSRGARLPAQQGQEEGQVQREADHAEVDQDLQPPVVQVRDAGELGEGPHPHLGVASAHAEVRVRSLDRKSVV